MLSIIKKSVSTRSIRYFSSSLIKHCLQKETWDIYSAVSLERIPIISRDLNELERKFSNLLHQIEYERSHKSNFEIRVELDEKRAKEFKEGNVNINEMDGFPKQTGQDFIDSCMDELKSFKCADRKSGKEIENDPKSINRALDRYLLLLINDKIGQTEQWILPQGKHNPGETLRQTAERVLIEKCGENIVAKFIGNAPCGFYKYRYPKSVRVDSSVGAKIFFFKAEYVKGQIESGKSKCTDYAWATREELDKLSYDYRKKVSMFLIDEEH